MKLRNSNEITPLSKGRKNLGHYNGQLTTVFLCYCNVQFSSRITMRAIFLNSRHALCTVILFVGLANHGMALG